METFLLEPRDNSFYGPSWPVEIINPDSQVSFVWSPEGALLDTLIKPPPYFKLVSLEENSDS